MKPGIEVFEAHRKLLPQALGYKRGNRVTTYCAGHRVCWTLSVNRHGRRWKSLTINPQTDIESKCMFVENPEY